MGELGSGVGGTMEEQQSIQADRELVLVALEGEIVNLLIGHDSAIVRTPKRPPASCVRAKRAFKRGWPRLPNPRAL